MNLCIANSISLINYIDILFEWIEHLQEHFRYPNLSSSVDGILTLYTEEHKARYLTWQIKERENQRKGSTPQFHRRPKG